MKVLYIVSRVGKGGEGSVVKTSLGRSRESTRRVELVEEGVCRRSL